MAPDQLQLRAEWVLKAEQREHALVKRHAVEEAFQNRATRVHEELALGAY